MLHILFLPGTFGSTLNHVIQTYIVHREDANIKSESFITEDGSMHLFDKKGHWTTRNELDDFFAKKIDQDIDISTPIYPMPDAKATEIIELFKKYRSTDKYIFVHINNVPDAELIMLMQYYKISKGILNMSVDIFCGNNTHNIVNWNSNYTHWSQMQTWELREWLSLFYEEWINEWINAKNHIPASWFTINASDVLNNTIDTFKLVCNYYNKLDDKKSNELESFASVWRLKQQYIIDEYLLIDTIVNNVINNVDTNWNPISIISEAMIQKKLRSLGYEIKCYNLNDFPTNSRKLYSLLEKI